MNAGGFSIDFAQLATLLAALATFGAQVHARVAGRGKDRSIETIEAEVKPNGGSSMRDAVNRIESLVTDLATRVATLERHRVPPWRR